jgi:acylphosphatase
MKKCLKISFKSHVSDRRLRDSVQTVARKLGIEGTVQFVEPNEIVIIACGPKDDIDGFLDVVHQGFGANAPEDVHIEPFLKERDYRGIFRILE